MKKNDLQDKNNIFYHGIPNDLSRHASVPGQSVWESLYYTILSLPENVCLCARRCQTDPCDECEHQAQTHAVGDRWKSDPCQLCQCLPNLTVQCSPYCPYTFTGCPQVKPISVQVCCGWRGRVLVYGMLCKVMLNGRFSCFSVFNPEIFNNYCTDTDPEYRIETSISFRKLVWLEWLIVNASFLRLFRAKLWSPEKETNVVTAKVESELQTYNFCIYDFIVIEVFFF